MKSHGSNKFINRIQKSTRLFDSFERVSLLKHFSVLGSGTLIAQVFMAINALLLARFLSPSAYGQLVIVFSISSITSIIFNFGLDTWILRTSAAGSRIAEVTGIVISIKTMLAVVWLILLTIIIPSLQPQVFPQNLLLLSALDVWMDSLLRTQNAAFAAQAKFGHVSILLLFARIGRLAGTLLLIAAGSPTLIQFVFLRALATLATVLISLWLMKPKFQRFHLKKYRSIIGQSAPYAISDLLSLLYLQADVSLLGVILGDTREVGLYTPASGLINALFVIPYSAYMVLVPYLTKLHARSRFVSASIRDIFIVLTAMGVVLWFSISSLGGRMMLLLLGDEYQRSGLLLMALSPILFFKSIGFAAVAILVAVDWQRKRVVVQAASAILNLILNILLIPSLAVWGAVQAYIMSEALLMLGYVWLVRGWMKTQSDRVEGPAE